MHFLVTVQLAYAPKAHTACCLAYAPQAHTAFELALSRAAARHYSSLVRASFTRIAKRLTV